MPEDDLWKKYFTSSAEIKKLRKEGGEFTTEIVYQHLDALTAFNVEQELIKVNITNPLILNKYYMEAKQKIFSFAGRKHSEETLSKKRGQRPWNAGLTKLTDERVLNYSNKPAWNRGIPTDDKVKLLISQQTTGIKKSEITKEKMQKPKSAAHSENISKAAKQRPKFECSICGKLTTKANINNHRKSHNVTSTV